MENQIFEVCSRKGLSPKFIESDGESYRIEEFFEGKGFTNMLLQETNVIEQTMKLVCEFNYDEDLFALTPKDQISIKALEFVDDQQKGWYWKAINEVYPLIDQIKERLPDCAEKWPSIFSILDEVKKTLYTNPEVFI